MTTKTKQPTSQEPATTQLLMVDPKLIDVTKDFNPRQHFDADADKALTQSVAMHGVKQSLLVTESDNGRYHLVAGERRLRAALSAKLASVPVMVDAPSPETALHALMENLARADINPIEEAAAITKILATTKISQKDLATSLARSASHITERKRLLELPDDVQALIASGALPTASARFLQKIAATTPLIASYFAAFLADPAYAQHRVDPERAADRLTRELFNHAAEGFRDLPPLPALAKYDERLTPRNIVLEWPDNEHALRDSWIAHVEEAKWNWHYATPDAANDVVMQGPGRVEILPETEDYHSIWLTTDASELIEYIRAAVIDWEAQLEAEAAEAAARSSKDKQTAKAKDPNEPSEHELREKARHEAHIANTEIGRNSLTKLSSITPTLPIIKILALSYLQHNRDLPGAGLALTDERLQTTETTEQKNGKTKTKITYASNEEAFTILSERITNAKTVEEVLGHIFGAIIAADHANPDATLISDRRFWSSRRRISSEYAPIPFVVKEFGKLSAKVLPRKSQSRSKTKK